MANEEHLAILRRGVDAWNAWREQNSDIRPDLRKADLSQASGTVSLVGADLRGADLYGANLDGAFLGEADLRNAVLIGAKIANTSFVRADLRGARFVKAAYLAKAHLAGAVLTGVHLPEANLQGANLQGAKLRGTKLRGAYLGDADLRRADLHKANLQGANLVGASLVGAVLRGANLRNAGLFGAYLSEADLRGADLRGANLQYAVLVGTQLAKAKLIGCRVYGMAAWDLKLGGAIQKDLIISPVDQPEITVDNLEVAQFIYLLLNNERIRHVIDTVTSKVVLILGRFTPQRKAVLDALRQQLRKRDYLPVLFDFDKPASKDLTGTIQTLANMARFVIADLTDPSSVPHELATIAPNTVVPIQTIIAEGQREYAMFADLHRRHRDWVLAPYRYVSSEQLLADLGEHVIAPAEAKARELRAGLALG